MWARICECVLALWLILSYFLFSSQNESSFIIAFFVFFFAGLSFTEKLNKLHLLQIFPAGWLLYLGYSYPTPWLPISMQSDILVGLFLLMFAVVPSHASDHPRPWRRFLQDHDK